MKIKMQFVPSTNTEYRNGNASVCKLGPEVIIIKTTFDQSIKWEL